MRRSAFKLVLSGVVLLLGGGAAAMGQQDEIDGVFPQLGTGQQELEDAAVVKGLEAALKDADKGRGRRAALVGGRAGVSTHPGERRLRMDAHAREKVRNGVRRSLSWGRDRNDSYEAVLSAQGFQPGDRLAAARSSATTSADRHIQESWVLRHGDLQRMNLKSRL